MRLHRFYIGSGQILPTSIGEAFTLEEKGHKDLIHQLIHVFRYKIGQQVIFFDGSGSDFLFSISETGRKGVALELVELKKGLAQEKSVALCFSLIKKDNIELILQKCTELGATEFFPLLSERSEKKDFNLERGEKIIIEAVEQSGWSNIPKLNDVMSLKEVVEKTKGHTQIIFNAGPVSDAVLDKGQKIALFIGPEGGWSDTELELFKENNIQSRSLGAQTLRAETAAIVAVGNFL